MWYVIKSICSLLTCTARTMLALSVVVNGQRTGKFWKCFPPGADICGTARIGRSLPQGFGTPSPPTRYGSHSSAQAWEGLPKDPWFSQIVFLRRIEQPAEHLHYVCTNIIFLINCNGQSSTSTHPTWSTRCIPPSECYRHAGFPISF